MIQKDTESFLQNVALLVLDMQAGFLKVVSAQEKLIRRTAFAIETAGLFGMRTFFTEQSPDKLGHTEESLLNAAGLDSPDSAIVFPKNTFSALSVDSLCNQLTNHDIHHLLVCGLEVPICVYQTALSALELEMQVTLISDAIGGRREEDFPPVLSTLQDHGCYLLPSETIFYSLLSTAAHPAFRDMTALVKKYSQ